MFFNSLVILIDGWNKHLTGVFHFSNLNKAHDEDHHMLFSLVGHQQLIKEL